MLKKTIKWLGILLLILLLVLLIIGWAINDPLPKGKSGPAADSLAVKMQGAVDKAAWDTTVIVQWTFAGRHHFLWDKNRNIAQISWDDYRVLLDLGKMTGKVWKSEIPLDEAQTSQWVQKAWQFWCNDSFWLNPVVKASDKGTKRSIVPMKNGQRGLLVTYSAGGVTPGDSYLWILDENGLPKQWKMWVGILPLGGIGNSWENWVSLPTGAKIATSHKNAVFDLKITDLKAAQHWEDFGFEKDPFGELF